MRPVLMARRGRQAPPGRKAFRARPAPMDRPARRGLKAREALPVEQGFKDQRVHKVQPELAARLDRRVPKVQQDR